MATFSSTITGSNTGDTLIGTANNQLIVAGTGNDSISSGFSLSSLAGNAGNDTFLVSASMTPSAVVAEPTAFISATPSSPMW